MSTEVLSLTQAKIVVPLIIGAGGAYYLFGRNRSTTARSENAGSGQVVRCQAFALQPHEMLKPPQLW